MSRRVIWTDDAIIAAMRQFTRAKGRRPTATDFNTSPSMRGRRRKDFTVEEFYAGQYPHLTTVVYRFGSWNDAILACGWEPVIGRAFRGQLEEAVA